MNDIIQEYATRTDTHPREVVRMLLAAYLLAQMLDTPTHGLTGQASKEVKVKAAFDYADLLMKG